MSFGALSFVALPFVGGVLAVIFGYRSRSEAQRRGSFTDPWGKAGRILGWINLVISVVVIIGFFGAYVRPIGDAAALAM